MTRSTLLPVIAAVALTVTCASAGAAPPAATPAPTSRQEKAPAPDKDKMAKARQVEVWVNAKAIPELDPVVIEEGTTDVVWLGRKGVKNVLIFFKAECKDQPSSAKPPVDPPCSGDQCLLDKAATTYRVGTHCYTIVAVGNDGTVETNDPKLIIKPSAH